MFLINTNDAYKTPLTAEDAQTLGPEAATEVERFLTYRESKTETPLASLPMLARELGASIQPTSRCFIVGSGMTTIRLPSRTSS
nr:diaminopropionate ammonia-lyase [Rhizobium sp. TCK]